MIDSSERLVNLALYLASVRHAVTAEDCRAAGLGYPDDQDDAAFIRMFERDKEALRAAGIAIVVDEDERYRVDPEATFSTQVTLTADEAATLRTSAAALSGDESFPFAADLSIALAKLGQGSGASSIAVSALSDEDPHIQGSSAGIIAEAIAARKLVSFDYTNARGESRHHEVAPYGLFFREGRWYMVALDTGIGRIRVYALARAAELQTNPSSPKTPDFERPRGFSVDDYSLLPFQYGPEETEAVVRFSPEDAWRAQRLTGGRGTLEEQDDGSALWRVAMGEPRALAAWCIENGPGITPLEPDTVVMTARLGLKEVLARHDR
ncbi:MAG: WYL domain-containing protein [Actinomycetia bacterium]|nr:WYL domain-containing protein [Actinomycetes bacterium]